MKNSHKSSEVLALEDQWQKQADRANAANGDQPWAVLLDNCKIDDLKVPTLPASTAILIEMCHDADVDFDKLSGIIESDPGLATHMLRLANSAYYGQSNEISSIARAITVLGLKQVRTIGLSYKLTAVIKEASSSEFDFEAYWEKSLAKAVIAKEIAREMGSQLLDEAFLVGLLQDIGILILQFNKSTEYQQIVDEVEANPDTPIWRLERQEFGLDHAKLGAAVCAMWKFPDTLTEAIQQHITPVKHVHLADPHSLLHAVAHGAYVVPDVLLGLRPPKVLAQLRETGVLKSESMIPVFSRAHQSLKSLSSLFASYLPGNAPIANLIQEAVGRLKRLAEKNRPAKNVA